VRNLGNSGYDTAGKASKQKSDDDKIVHG